MNTPTNNSSSPEPSQQPSRLSWFHCGHGIYFARRPSDAAVLMVQKTHASDPITADDDENYLYAIDKDTWASLVCSVSSKGEDASRVQAITNFHGKCTGLTHSPEGAPATHQEETAVPKNSATTEGNVADMANRDTEKASTKTAGSTGPTAAKAKRSRQAPSG